MRNYKSFDKYIDKKETFEKYLFSDYPEFIAISLYKKKYYILNKNKLQRKALEYSRAHKEQKKSYNKLYRERIKKKKLDEKLLTVR